MGAACPSDPMVEDAALSGRASSALWPLLRADGASGRSHRRVRCHSGANERLQRLFINLVALMEIDGTPGVAVEAGVEEACATIPEPLSTSTLDHFGVGLLDESSDPSERLAPPITQLLDSRIDQLRGRVSPFFFLRAALALLHGGW